MGFLTAAAPTTCPPPPITTGCSSTSGYPCILTGSTNGSVTCTIRVQQAVKARTYVAYLTLTQDGQSEVGAASTQIDKLNLN